MNIRSDCVGTTINKNANIYKWLVIDILRTLYISSINFTYIQNSFPFLCTRHDTEYGHWPGFNPLGVKLIYRFAMQPPLRLVSLPLINRFQNLLSIFCMPYIHKFRLNSSNLFNNIYVTY